LVVGSFAKFVTDVMVGADKNGVFRLKADPSVETQNQYPQRFTVRTPALSLDILLLWTWFWGINHCEAILQQPAMETYVLVAILLAVVCLVQHRSSPNIPSSIPRLQDSSFVPFNLYWRYLTDCRRLFLEAYQTVSSATL
jgi:hypothetical protein